MDHAVLTAQVAEDIDVIDERRKAGEGAQVRAALVARQVVDIGDVRHKIALVRVLQEEVGGYGLRTIGPWTGMLLALPSSSSSTPVSY
ncbi:MAG: hypothetical protein AB2556_25330, partial [Candidatus Thiodiazotropha sp.]